MPSRVSALSVACLALVATSAAAGTAPVLKPVPVTPKAGIGKMVPAVTLKVTGNLKCDLANQTCMIRNMPVLGQSDPALNAPLKAYIDTLAVGGMVHNGSFDKDGNANLSTPQDFANAIQGYGCLITSATMVLHAAYANAPPGLSLSGREAELNDVQAGLAPGLSQPQSQLLWQYKTQAKQAQAMNYPANGEAGPLYIGVVDLPGDITGVKATLTDEVPNAATAPHVTDNLIAGMKNGAIYGISFQWSTLVAEINHGSLVEFDIYESGPHKVAVSGFVSFPGANYPLIVNDPGSGATVKVRLTSSVASLNLPYIKATAAQIDAAPVYYVAADGSKTLAANPPVFFIYAGAEPNAGGHNFQVSGGVTTGYPIVVIEDIWSIRLAPQSASYLDLVLGTPQAVDKIHHPIPEVRPATRQPLIAVPNLRNYSRN